MKNNITGSLLIQIPGELGFVQNFGFLWRQWPKISSLLLRLAVSGLKIMQYFSLVQSEHIPLTGENCWPLSRIFQDIVYSILFLFRSQICWLKTVSVLYFSHLKDFVWFAYRVLNCVEHSPTYVWVSAFLGSGGSPNGGSIGVTVAW